MEYGGVQQLHVPSDHIWRPDIVLYNKYVYCFPNKFKVISIISFFPRILEIILKRLILLRKIFYSIVKIEREYVKHANGLLCFAKLIMNWVCYSTPEKVPVSSFNLMINLTEFTYLNLEPQYLYSHVCKSTKWNLFSVAFPLATSEKENQLWIMYFNSRLILAQTPLPKWNWEL